MPREPRPYDSVKRALDVTLSAVGLVVTAPVQLVTAGVVLATLGRPVLFRHARPGLDGKVFELVKFRTMKHPDAQLQTDAARLTKVGRFCVQQAWTSCRRYGTYSRATWVAGPEATSVHT